MLPEGLKSLGDSAFYACAGLTEVTVPEGITWMSGTFAACYSLHTLNLPNSLTSMSGVVEECRSLETLHLPSKLEYISGIWPSKLKTVTTAFGSVRYVSEDGILYDTQDNSILFVNASITGNVTVRDGITTIGAGAFKGRKGLTSVTLPESCTVIVLMLLKTAQH